MGFSTSTLTPARSNGPATCAWDAVGVATTTASTRPMSEPASGITDVACAAAMSFARSGF